MTIGTAHIKRLTRFSILLGIYAYLFFLLLNADFSFLKEISVSLFFKWVSLLLLVASLNFFPEVKKWQYCLKTSLPNSLASYAVLKGILFGLITPNRFGEYYGRKLPRISWRETLFSVFISRALQSLPTFLFGIPAIFFFLQKLLQLEEKILLNTETLYALSLVSLLAISGIFFRRKKIPHYLKLLLAESKRFLEHLKTRNYVPLLFFTFLRYLAFVFGWTIFLALIHPGQVNLPEIFKAMACVFLLKTLFPVTFFSGFGIREFFAVFILSELGFSVGEILFASFSMFLASHLLPSFVALIILTAEKWKKNTGLKAGK